MCSRDDSAESRGTPDVPLSTCTGGDSAESRAATSVPVACTGGNHARSSGGTSVITGRALLERLLDEGEAPGGVEPEMIAGLAATAFPEPTTVGVREAGVLHQRADATRAHSTEPRH